MPHDSTHVQNGTPRYNLEREHVPFNKTGGPWLIGLGIAVLIVGWFVFKPGKTVSAGPETNVPTVKTVTSDKPTDDTARKADSDNKSNNKGRNVSAGRDIKADHGSTVNVHNGDVNITHNHYHNHKTTETKVVEVVRPVIVERTVTVRVPVPPVTVKVNTDCEDGINAHRKRETAWGVPTGFYGR